MGRQQKIKDERRMLRKHHEVVSRRRGQRISAAVIIVLVVALLGVWGVVLIRQEQNKPKTTEGNQTSVNRPIATIETDRGTIKFEMYPDAAPKTVANFIKLANDGFYNGTTFHRVVADFVIQGGDPLSKDNDPTNDGTGGPGYTFEDEINPKSLGLSDAAIAQLTAQGYKYNDKLTSHKMEKMSVAMANSGPATNGSQFFIVTTQAQPHLDGRHTVFGTVIEGQDVVLKIQQGDKMNKVTVAE